MGWVSYKNKKYRVLKEYTILCLSTIVLIVVMLIMPLLKADYNLTRLYLQGLIILSPVLVFGTERILISLKDKVDIIIACFIVVFFLNSSGVIAYSTSGIPQVMYSNNSRDYFLYYSTGGDVAAAQWLGSRQTSLTVYADQLASLKLMSYGGITNVQDEIYPSTITKYSYVYASSTNMKGFNLHYGNNGLFEYNFPINFLNSYKDTIYSNQNSKIYR